MTFLVIFCFHVTFLKNSGEKFRKTLDSTDYIKKEYLWRRLLESSPSLVPITFDVHLTEKPKPFYMLTFTKLLTVVPYQKNSNILIRPCKTTCKTTKRKYPLGLNSIMHKTQHMK